MALLSRRPGARADRPGLVPPEACGPPDLQAKVLPASQLKMEKSIRPAKIGTGCYTFPGLSARRGARVPKGHRNLGGGSCRHAVSAGVSWPSHGQLIIL